MARSEPRNWLPGWAGRTQVERVELYTRASLFVIFWLLVALAALGAGNLPSPPSAIVGILVGAVAAGSLGHAAAAAGDGPVPRRAPLPRPDRPPCWASPHWPRDSSSCCPRTRVLRSDHGRGSARPGRRWAARPAGAVVPLRRLAGIMLISTGMIGLAAYGLAMGLFLIFTCRARCGCWAWSTSSTRPAAARPPRRRRGAAALLPRRARRARPPALDHRRTGRAGRDPVRARRPPSPRADARGARHRPRGVAGGARAGPRLPGRSTSTPR